MSKINLEKLFEDEMNALHPVLVSFAHECLCNTTANSMYYLVDEYAKKFEDELSPTNVMNFFYDHQEFWADWLDVQSQADFLHECTMVEVARMFTVDYFNHGINWEHKCRLVRIYILNQLINNTDVEEIDNEVMRTFLSDDTMGYLESKSLEVANRLVTTIASIELIKMGEW